MKKTLTLFCICILSGHSWAYLPQCDHKGTRYDECPIEDPDNVRPEDMSPEEGINVINPRCNNAIQTISGRYVTTKHTSPPDCEKEQKVK